ncbi:MAG: hypothetical protein CMI18_04175 [Opitutaceae bacterium]|nr:hypothetical protein [Opitutaceae bacterium]
MSYLAKKNRSFPTRCFVACQTAVMLLLILSLMLLLTALAVSIIYDEIPVPEPLEEVVNNALKEQGLEIDYEKITVDFGANLFIENATISFTALDDPILKVDSLYLDINYAGLIRKRFPLEKLIVNNAVAYSPGIVSQSGVSEPVLESLNLSFSKKWSEWELSFLSGRMQSLCITGNGSLRALVAELMKLRPGKEDPPDLYLSYLQAMRHLSGNLKYLKSLENPRLNLIFSSPSTQQFLVDFQLVVDSLKPEGLPEFRDIVHRSTAQILPDFGLMAGAETRIQSINSRELDFTARNLFLRSTQPTKLAAMDSIFPLEVETAVGEISLNRDSLDHAVFKGRILSKDDAHGILTTSLYNKSVSVELAGNWKDQTASGSLSGSLNLMPIIERPELDHLWKLRWSKQHRPIFLDADFRYPGNIENIEVAFRVETRDLDIIKTPFQWARARGELKGTKVKVPYLAGGGYGNDLLCSFSQDFKNPFYRFTMKGLFRPHDIDIWWRDWWKKTFNYLNIKAGLPYMDLSIRNAFIYKKQLTLFGYAEAKNIDLKGMHFDEAAVKMFVRPNYIDALELKLKRQEGQAEGQFQRQLVKSKLKNVIVDLTSNIDLEPSMKLFGESGLKIIEPYTWKGNPTISLQGEFNFEKDTNWQDLVFKIDTEDPMTLYKFPFDSLKVDGHYDHGDVLLHEVDFGFAGGVGKGEASYLRQDDQSYLLFDFNVEEANLEETLKRIAIVKAPSEQIDPEKKKARKQRDPIKGKLTVHASGISPAGHGLDRIMAQGNISIREGNLAQIPLFGPLSTLIPFTKLTLNAADAFFAWDNGKMTFPALKMTSNTARLEGVGDYFTDSSDLDFQLRLYLLREAEIPVVSSIIMPLFDPVSTIGSINLKGTITDPEWRFALSPFNFLDEKPEATEGKDREDLNEFEFRK